MLKIIRLPLIIAIHILILQVSSYAKIEGEIKDSKDLENSLLKLDQWRNENLNNRLIGLEVPPTVPMEKSGLSVVFIPNRSARVKNENLNTKNNGCPFDKYKDENFQPAWEWKNYFIMNNTYPYTKEHDLLITKEHEGQETMSSKIQDMIDFISMTNNKTFFFNHYSGNSEKHFHLHIMGKSRVSFEDFLENEQNRSYLHSIESREEKIKFKVKKDVKAIIVNDQKCKRGIYLESTNKEKLVKTITSELTYLDEKKIPYNLIFFAYHQEDKKFRSLVIIKGPYTRPLTMIEKISGQTIHVAGLHIIDSFTVPLHSRFAPIIPYLIDEIVLNECKATVLDPQTVF